MHEGRIAHFEDHPLWREIVESLLEGSNHRIVAEASTLSESYSVLERIQTGELDANIVITDGNLDSVNSHDALLITKRIRKLGLPIWVIGLAADSMTGAGVSVDVDLQKSDLKPDQLVRIIDELPEPVLPKPKSHPTIGQQE